MPLPPGPRLPGPVQTVFFLTRPHSFLSGCQRRHGDVFTLNLAIPGETNLGKIIYLADTEAIKTLFSEDGSAGHAGVANQVLEPIAGPNSILLLDRDRHLRERRLLGPAFHGGAINGLESIVREATERELAAWPAKGVFALRPAMQRITFEVILRAALGVRDPQLQERLAFAFDPVFNLSVAQVASLAPGLRRDFGPWSPWGRLRRSLEYLDAILGELISERRLAEPREDILGTLLAAVDEDGEPLSDAHVRDELVTLLLAGHETTATALAWAFERLAHHPVVTSTLRAELARGAEGSLDAVIAETLRVRPVVMDVARQLSEAIEVGGFHLPAGSTVMPGIYLVHFDRRNHEDPEEFRPDRFRETPPSKATWLPFGGGRRRCVGAALAQTEMRIVLSMVLREFIPRPSSGRAERPRLRAITFVPEHGARLGMCRAPLALAS